MIKFILRKTAFKKYDKETQDHLLPFLEKKYTTVWFSVFIFYLITYIAPMVLLAFSAHGKEFDSIENILLGIGILLYTVASAFFYLGLTHEIFQFTTILIPTKLYAIFYTKKGKAISKKDFKIIEKNNPELYEYITSYMCQGYCYSICFAILKTLKKGSLKFLAVKKIDGANEVIQAYTMHVLYEKNGWIFDTYNQRQYPVEKSITLHKGIVYKDFSYEDIKDLTYEEFIETNHEELAKWCEEHDCYQKWHKNKD